MINLSKEKIGNDFDLEAKTIRIVRMGVICSAVLMITGLVLSVLFSFSSFSSVAEPNISGKIFGKGNNSIGIFLTFSGIIILVSTPILRVFTLFFSFIKRKDWRFALVALFVFILLSVEIIYSLTI